MQMPCLSTTSARAAELQWQIPFGKLKAFSWFHQQCCEASLDDQLSFDHQAKIRSWLLIGHLI